MIYCLLQSSSAHLDLSTGQVPLELLTPAEQKYFEQLKAEKRRHDWLLGRWTGKRLMQAVIGKGIPLNAIEILPAEDGAPMVRVQASQGRGPWMLSISHSHDCGFCGGVEGDVPLGVDIERVEARTEGFARDYFVGEELALVETTPREGRDGIVTAIWSAKEAALKAIRVGLLLDTSAVTCLPQGNGLDWSPLTITWNALKLKRAAPALTGWWRRQGDFVLTLAIGQNGSAHAIYEVF